MCPADRGALDALVDAVRLWRVTPGPGWGDVIDAATAALVADLDTPSST